MIYSGTYTAIKADVPEFFMRKFIKLEKISTNCKRIQKKLNKKWLTCGIFTCVAAIAMIGSYRYISGIVKVSSNVNGKELPIYCVQTDEKKVALSFDAACASCYLRKYGMYSPIYMGSRNVLRLDSLFLQVLTVNA